MLNADAYITSPTLFHFTDIDGIFIIFSYIIYLYFM